MNTEKTAIYYINSHGCNHSFITRRDNKISVLKKRKFVYVLPEVVEIIDRLQKRNWKEVSMKAVCLELFVHPATIDSIFKYLVRIGLLGEEETVPQSEHGRDFMECSMEEFEAFKKVFPILRSIKEEDYGKSK